MGKIKGKTGIEMKPKSIRFLKRKLWRIFSKYIRRRDNGKPCISCGKMSSKLQAGHYYPRSTTYASLYFDETNVNGQCIHCNLFLEGNKQGYREGIIKRYGAEALQILEIRKSLKSIWGWWEYEVMITLYADRVKELGDK